MISTATYPGQHPTSTCPKTAAFYPCPQNMSIAWTYRPPYVQFLEEFGHVYRRGHRCVLVNLRISLPFRELIALYWQIGKDILTRQAEQGWGAKIIERLSRDLRAAFPDLKGFSRANLHHMRAFAEAWPDSAIVQQAVGQLPWGHNIGLLTRLKSPEWRLAYAHRAIEQKSDRFKREQLRMNLPSIERIEAELAGETLRNEDDKGDGS